MNSPIPVNQCDRNAGIRYPRKHLKRKEKVEAERIHHFHFHVFRPKRTSLCSRINFHALQLLSYFIYTSTPWSLHLQNLTWPRMQIIQTIRPLNRRLFHPRSLLVNFSGMAAPRQTSEKATEDLAQAMGRLTTSDNGQPSTDDPKPSKSRWRTAKPKRSEPNSQEASTRARSPKRKGTQAPSMGKPLAFRPAHKHRGTILLSFRRPSSRHPSYRQPPLCHHFFRHHSLNQLEL